MNAITIVGHLGKDPEMRYTPNGVPVTRFSVAVNRPSKKKETDWFTCEVWEKQAEFAGEYLRKGSLVSVRGRMENDRWEDQNGVRREGWKLKVERLESLSKKQENDAAPSTPGEEEDIDEIPF